MKWRKRQKGEKGGGESFRKKNSLKVKTWKRRDRVSIGRKKIMKTWYIEMANFCTMKHFIIRSSSIYLIRNSTQKSTLRGKKRGSIGKRIREEISEMEEKKVPGTRFCSLRLTVLWRPRGTSLSFASPARRIVVYELSSSMRHQHTIFGGFYWFREYSYGRFENNFKPMTLVTKL